jgi:hypothetical protein
MSSKLRFWLLAAFLIPVWLGATLNSRYKLVSVDIYWEFRPLNVVLILSRIIVIVTTKNKMEPIRIFYFSDVFCIWAYIAQIRLNELKTTFQDQIEIEHYFVSVFGTAREKLETRWRDRGGLAGYSNHVLDVAKKINFNEKFYNEFNLLGHV